MIQHSLIRLMIAWLLAAIGVHAQDAAPPPVLLTKAESSDYQATSTHAEVVAFCEALAKESPRVVLTTFGKSQEGRDLPLLILSKDGIEKADKRMTVLCVGNIHAGEVCGKEALLMLARDLAREEDPGVLEHLNLLIAPIYNADGNEAFSTDNRPGQVGPAQGMGKRENAQGLDLNRDYIKLEAPETRALVRLYNEWDPALVIDTHTTNGSHHRYTLTYDGPRHPATDPRIVDYLREQFLPKVGAKLKARSGYDSFFYGNFSQDHQRWETYPALPRYGAHYLGLRQRMAILSEAYAYAPYKDRVLCTRDFVQECLALAAKRHDRITAILTKARKKSLKLPMPLRHQLAPFEEKRTVKGVVERQQDGKTVPTDEPKDYHIDYWGKSAVTLSVDRPFAYLIPAHCANVVENLQRHGIAVEELREDIELNVSEFTLTGIQSAETAFQNHHLVSIQSAESADAARRIAAGTWVVRTKQPLGTLAVFLLEPQSEDGLLVWNFFDPLDNQDGKYPIARLEKSQTLLTTAARPLPEDRKVSQPVTFEMLHGKGDERLNLNGELTAVSWLEDGESFLQVRADRLYKVDAQTGRTERFLAPKKLRESLAAIPAIDDEELELLSKRTYWQMNPSRTSAVFDYRDDLYHLPFDGSPACRLTNTPGSEELTEFSPDGLFIAFVRHHNLHVIDLATRQETALTIDGEGDISNGKAAWVYFEELYDRSWKAYWWSPDSRHLAFHRFDSSRLPMFRALNTLPLHGDVVEMRHPKSGDPNPDVQLGVVHVAGGATTWMDLSGYTAGSFIVSHVGWMPDGDQLYYYIQDRAQKWLDFLTCPKTGGTSETWFRDTTEAWVESPGEAYFVSDGVIIPSERSGWRHLYHYKREGKTWQTITAGPWEVRSVHHLDEVSGQVYFSGTKDSHLAENLYRCSLDGSKLERLTEGHGTHQSSLDPQAKFFTDTSSDHQTPSQLRLHRTDGALVRTLDSNPVHKLEELALAKTEFLQIPARDGVVLEGMLITPNDFDPNKRYPVWFQTYAGPHAPVVHEGWGRSQMNDQMLANMGVVVFRLDPRSASGKGAQSAWTAYRQLGIPELQDITDGIEWLKKKPHIDAQRIGMSGHSYGGFMTAFAMTHSKLFAAGISGAPVTDWHYYDSIYTERYMDTPENNREGYDNTSVIRAAKDLHGKLLLLHGLMDDNVHLQNSTQFIKALQDADKSFQIMVYPEMEHGLHGTHYQRLLVDFITEVFDLEK